MTSARVLPELWVCRLPGTVGYEDGLALQERLRAARQAELIPDAMLLLEHPPVFTRGRRTGEGELMMPEAWYQSLGIQIVDVNRGGKITYHGPGQLVGYPIVRVGDIVEYVRRLERAIVRALGEHGVGARVRTAEGSDFTGVWVEDRKIASIGVHVARGVTTHGFAVNIVNDLSPFDWVVACGLPNVRMTSVTRELSAEPAGRELVRCFERRVAFAVAEELGRRQRIVTAARLEAALAAAEADGATGVLDGDGAALATTAGSGAPNHAIRS